MLAWGALLDNPGCGLHACELRVKTRDDIVLPRAGYLEQRCEVTRHAVTDGIPLKPEEECTRAVHAAARRISRAVQNEEAKLHLHVDLHV